MLNFNQPFQHNQVFASELFLYMHLKKKQVDKIELDIIILII